MSTYVHTNIYCKSERLEFVGLFCFVLCTGVYTPFMVSNLLVELGYLHSLHHQTTWLMLFVSNGSTIIFTVPT